MRISKLFLLSCVVVLAGAGCLGSKAETGPDGGVFKTIDGGQEWAQAVAVPSARGVGTIAGTNIVAMEMDPQDHEVIYLGTRENGMLYSLDAGSSWQQPRATVLREGAIAAMEVDPSNVCTGYFARGPRVYKTTDCLRTIDSETYVETRAGVNIVRIAVDWFNTQVVWLGLSNGDVLKSENGGDTWRTVLVNRRAVTSILINNADSRIVLVGLENDGFQKTVDAGATWVSVEDELKDFRNANRVHALTQDATSSNVLAATAYGILRSTDFGSTWTPLALVTSPGQVTINALGMDPNNANTIYYAAGGTFYISNDGGVNWDTQRLPTARQPQVLLVDPENPNVVYVGAASVED